MSKFGRPPGAIQNSERMRDDPPVTGFVFSATKIRILACRSHACSVYNLGNVKRHK
ncbi:hypothetical protein Mal65_00550 [Crateriforma conspicua]|nr:hypothetical protein Mal65_00550 [Crateriforma conspicua]